MKLISIISHPVTLIISFLMIMISGKSIGGFYVLYFVLGLPYGQLYSIVALAGIMAILCAIYVKSRRSRVKAIINLSGVMFLFCSVFLFFYNDKDGYNYGTFYQSVPIMSFLLFLMIAFCFLLRNLKDLNNVRTDYQAH
jgi:hypothetical protein